MTDIAFDMAREMARHVDAGRFLVRDRRRDAQSVPDRDCRRHAAGIANRPRPNEDLEDEREEAVRKVADLLFNGGTDAKIKAAIERTKLSAETLFPKPDKTRS